MWPVQTLTLLLCLTDDEQLFAQQIPQVPVLQAMEMEQPTTDPRTTDKDLLWDPTC